MSHSVQVAELTRILIKVSLWLLFISNHRIMSQRISNGINLFTQWDFSHQPQSHCDKLPSNICDWRCVIFLSIRGSATHASLKGVWRWNKKYCWCIFSHVSYVFFRAVVSRHCVARGKSACGSGIDEKREGEAINYLDIVISFIWPFVYTYCHHINRINHCISFNISSSVCPLKL